MSMQLVDDQPPEIRRPLLEIHPQELKFTFEAKKQSSCDVHLTNLSDQYIAFKVKTTSPKKYCVRPNTGIVKPKSTRDFTVIMQAQRTVPLDLQCKDKFLIQSTVAPFGSSEEDIMPGLFAKDSGNYIEDCKLRVVLISPLHSPVLSPVNGVAKQEQSYVISTQKEKMPSGAENLPPPHRLDDNIEDEKPFMSKEELKPAQVLETVDSPPKCGDFESKTQESICSPSNTEKLTPNKNVGGRNMKLSEDLNGRAHAPSNAEKLIPNKDAEGRNMTLCEDIKELNSKFLMLNSKLNEAESTIARLKEEKISIIQEKEMLRQELARMKRKNGVRHVQRGFPPLFVCTVALISLAVGFFLRA